MLAPVDKLAYKRFYDFPFGKIPKASVSKYNALWNEEKNNNYEKIDHFENNNGYQIDKEWFHDLALLTQVVIKDDDLCYQHGRLLYSVLSKYISENKNNSVNILETGTARGFSSLCMAKALADSRQAGKIVTFDVLPHDVAIIWNCIADEKGPMSRSELLNNYKELADDHIIYVQGDSKLQLKKVQIPRLHLVFLDGAHTFEYVMQEFEQIKHKQQKGDVIFFDDYTPALFPGVVEAVNKICDSYGYSKEVITISEKRGYAIAYKTK
jgi:predicted O-methyltransferase YrrM